MKKDKKQYLGTLTKEQVEKLPIGFTPIYRTSPKWVKLATKKGIQNNRKRTVGRPIENVSRENVKWLRLPLLTKAYLQIQAFFKKQQNAKK